MNVDAWSPSTLSVVEGCTGPIPGLGAEGVDESRDDIAIFYVDCTSTWLVCTSIGYGTT